MEERKDIDKILEEFIERRLEGEVASLDDFIREHPELKSLDQGERARLEALLQYMDDPREPDNQEEGPTPEIPGYEILERRGAGSYGVVYRARDEKLGREVALKVIRPGVGHERLRKFLAEARMLAKASHENVVSIHSIGDQGPEFLCMEWIEGVDLAEYIRERRYLPTTEALGVARQLARALHCVHEQDLVHRDVKPSNVMVTKGGAVKLMDFGIARVGGESTDEPPHAIIGTPRYMAPEQILGEGVDARSDLFSFGIVLYELLTGKLPFAAATWDGLQRAILHDVPDSILKHRSDLPHDVVDLVEKLLMKDPDRRPQSAAEVESALSRVMIGVGAPEIRRRSGPARGRRWILVVAAILIIGGAVAVWYGLQLRGTATLVVVDEDGEQHEVLQGDALPTGTKLQLIWRANRPAHVYVWTMTETEELAVLFPIPDSDLENPVPAHAAVLPGYLPSRADEGVWTLDSSTGPQQVFLEASLEPIPALLEAMAQMKRVGLSEDLVHRGMSLGTAPEKRFAKGSSVTSLLPSADGVRWHMEFEAVAPPKKPDQP